jgi:hypothetical protein
LPLCEYPGGKSCGAPDVFTSNEYWPLLTSHVPVVENTNGLTDGLVVSDTLTTLLNLLCARIPTPVITEFKDQALLF